MFPVSDFNFVVAGIATFAATVGYACSRRLSTSPSYTPSEEVSQHSFAGDRRTEEKDTIISPHSSPDEPRMNSEPELSTIRLETESTVSISTSSPTRRDSLKRKIPHDGFDEPEKNLANIYPNKRSRTPSSDSGSSTPVVAPSVTADMTVPLTSSEDVEILDKPSVLQEPVSIPTPASEPPRSPSPAPEQQSPKQPSLAPTPASPLPVFISTPPPPIVPHEVTPRPITPKPFSSPSGGFAAFAGSTSPFAVINKPKQSTFKPAKSIWSTSDLTTHQNEEEKVALAAAFVAETENHAIGEAKATPLHPTEKYTHVTGEEEEDVELEQRGVKLYTKRGNKAFSEGVVGHVKLLSNRSTLEERILFRRDPLWKVSMNIRVKPAVRCTYVPEENVLRLILKETTEKTDEAEEKQEVVIYALKPGRSCPKQDFKDFAQALMKSTHLKASP
ncbi:hypothetical protein CVT25_002975 [Psilocybe cyanescens]|uniref:RanBD1 domain-containing protein n=1 Tax=Psilocybe cyanescens TaxID=93625 RepID=A0A409WMU5_PSICY|nr:hypothetical protein CVT25_002975 [Psilocybe cyanescens]